MKYHQRIRVTVYYLQGNFSRNYFVDTIQRNNGKLSPAKFLGDVIVNVEFFYFLADLEIIWSFIFTQIQAVLLY